MGDTDDDDLDNKKVRQKKRTTKKVEDDMKKIYEYWEYFGQHRPECEERRKDPNDELYEDTSIPTEGLRRFADKFRTWITGTRHSPTPPTHPIGDVESPRFPPRR